LFVYNFMNYKTMIEIIAFDADDTLWHNETLYQDAQERFVQLLSAYQDPAGIAQSLYETEMRNLAHFGYGIKSFALSMIETAIELTAGRISGSRDQQNNRAGKRDASG
jgi:putative hydrolase of the HAD superfamily